MAPTAPRATPSWGETPIRHPAFLRQRQSRAREQGYRGASSLERTEHPTPGTGRRCRMMGESLARTLGRRPARPPLGCARSIIKPLRRLDLPKSSLVATQGSHRSVPALASTTLSGSLGQGGRPVSSQDSSLAGTSAHKRGASQGPRQSPNPPGPLLFQQEPAGNLLRAGRTSPHDLAAHARSRLQGVLRPLPTAPPEPPPRGCPLLPVLLTTG